MKWLVVIILLAVFLHTSDCHSDNLCIPVRRDAQDPTSSPVVMQGHLGKIGPPGASGADGEPGAKGEPGINGSLGMKGSPGVKGAPGAKGAFGDKGAPGAKGSSGINGSPGVNGRPGSNGARGYPGQCVCDLSQIERRIQQLENKTSQQGESCLAGLKDERVSDHDMTSSSFHRNKHYAYYGRLDNCASNPRGYWHPRLGDLTGAWLQVDFKRSTRIVGVITQGRRTYDQWVTSYKITYGNSASSLRTIRNNCGGDMIFQGNRDRNTHVTNTFRQPVTARYFRLIVQTYHESPALRMEYLLC